MDRKKKDWKGTSPGGTVDRNWPANAADTGSIQTSYWEGLGRSHMLRATKPVHHSYWAPGLEPAIPKAHVPRACATREATAPQRRAAPTLHT